VLSVAKIITPHDADGERPTTAINSILAYSGLVGDRPSHFSSLFRILGDKTKNILVEQNVHRGMRDDHSMKSSVGQFHLP